MSKFCSKCGTELDDNTNFCHKCGNPTDNTQNNNTTIINNIYSSGNVPIITKREIAISIILSIITCGIYSIYWFIAMTDESNTVSGDNSLGGGLAFLLTLLTCGIYSIYWNYKMGKKMYEAGKRYNKEISDNSIIYLVLSLIGFSVVNYCLIQNDLNKFSD